MNDTYSCTKYNMKTTHMLLLLCLMIKTLKLFKIINIKKNSFYSKIQIIFSKTDWAEQLFNSFVYIIICLFAFYYFISIHIFIGHHSYPNWIIKSNSHNKKLISLYLISFYYLITTMTTV